MCGIVGYIGPQDATPIILNGLKRLEYRGYDSAGLAILQNGVIEVRRDAGKLARLASLVEKSPPKGHIGIGHTRWATHGEPNTRNAHPHMGMTGEVVLVHNGIVENERYWCPTCIKQGKTPPLKQMKLQGATILKIDEKLLHKQLDQESPDDR